MGQSLSGFAYYVNLLGKNNGLDTVKKSTEDILDANRKSGIQMNLEQNKCMFTSRQQNTGRSRSINMTIKLFGNKEKF
jgi:hypothetical protein